MQCISQLFFYRLRKCSYLKRETTQRAFHLIFNIFALYQSIWWYGFLLVCGFHVKHPVFAL